MAALRLREIRRYDLAGDLYAARVRGPSPELAVNLGYEGVLTVACLEQRVSPLVAFPDGGFSIYSWGMSPRGDVSVAFSAEPGEGLILLEHERGRARRLDVPTGLPPISELMWFSSSIGLLAYDGGLWTVEGAAVRPASESESASYLSQWHRRALAKRAVVKTDPYERGIYVQGEDASQRTIGFIPYATGVEPLLLTHDGSAIDVTSFGERLFVSFETEIVVSEAGSTEVILEPAEGERFVRVNVLEVHGRGYLSVIASDEDQRQTASGRVTFYELQ